MEKDLNEWHCSAIEALTEQLEAVQDAIDEVREEIQWANRNVPFVLHSMSKDPCDPHFKINNVPPEVVEELRNQVQRDLF